MSGGNTKSSNVSQGIKKRDIGRQKIPNKMLSQYINMAYSHAGHTYSHAEGWYGTCRGQNCLEAETQLSSNSNANETQPPLHCVQSSILHWTVNGITAQAASMFGMPV